MGKFLHTIWQSIFSKNYCFLQETQKNLSVHVHALGELILGAFQANMSPDHVLLMHINDVHAACQNTTKNGIMWKFFHPLSFLAQGMRI